MPFKKILPKLHNYFFPIYAKKIAILKQKVGFQDGELASERIELIKTKEELKKLYYRMKAEEAKQFEKKPTMADLMRECLGLLPIDFTNVIESATPEEIARMSPEEVANSNKDIGLPKDFLDTLDPKMRETYIAQLYQIWNMEVFNVMCKHYIDLQGNWTLKKAVDDMQLFAGRMSINGIYLIKNKVKDGHDEYKERSKAPEEFDEHELDEGFDITNLTNKQK